MLIEECIQCSIIQVTNNAFVVVLNYFKDKYSRRAKHYLDRSCAQILKLSIGTLKKYFQTTLVTFFKHFLNYFLYYMRRIRHIEDKIHFNAEPAHASVLSKDNYE